jgi:predicted HTH transcriptional regulator
MSIFTKPLSQFNADDLQELLQERAVENARLEFKREVPDKDETLKKLSSFANTFGGFMVVGASARSNDGRIEGLPGVDEQAGYKQKVVDWCFSGASPPLTVEVSDPIPVPAANGKICYVIHTPESDVAPASLPSPAQPTSRKSGPTIPTRCQQRSICGASAPWCSTSLDTGFSAAYRPRSEASQ